MLGNLDEFTIAVFGTSSTRKSALVIQFVQGYFITDYDPTIEDCYKRDISIDNEVVHLKILDTAGQDDFAPMRTDYMRRGQGFVLVYSVDDRFSFEEIEVFYRDLCRVKGTTDIVAVICGNNCDSDKRVVSKEEGEKLAQKLKLDFIESSPLANINVNQVFETLTRLFIQKKKPEPQLPPPKEEKKKKFSFFKKKKDI